MRLIDADALREHISVMGTYSGWNVIKEIDARPTAERKTGKWDERSVFDTEDSDIAQMQSAKCSVCGKYHTTPYLYFFDNFNYCPNCGADMRGDKDE